MVEKALAATTLVYTGHLKSAVGSCRVAFRPQLVNAENRTEPKTVGKVFYWETSTASTETGCG